MHTQFILHLTDGEEPELLRTEFFHPAYAPNGRKTVRGKDEGAYQADGTFQWTAAVRVLVAYLLRCAAWARACPNCNPEEECPKLEGRRNTPAASLNYALSKQTGWICDMFGFDRGGRPHLADLMLRSNADLKRRGEPVVLRLDHRSFPPRQIEVMVGGKLLEDPDEIERLAGAVEASWKSKGCGLSVVVLTLEGSAARDWTREKRRKVEQALVAAGIKGTIVAVEEGSIKLTLKLTREDAERLFWAVHSGELDELGVLDFDYVRSPERLAEVFEAAWFAKPSYHDKSLPDLPLWQHGGQHERPLDRMVPERVSSSMPAVRGYEILRTLAHGAMGIVYLARDVGLDRLVALKMHAHSGGESSEHPIRFLEEARALTHLHHPNIVQLYEIGEVQGRPFFSLEFCDGGTLTEQLKNKPPSPREAAALIETLARAVHYAHLRGVVHHDLKPSNVLLAGAERVPKITDFGLAKRIDAEARDVCRSGAFMGTPAYMAPEQAAGKVRDLGPAIDVYALGALLYECLTGRPPFIAATALETLVRVRTADPVPPSRLAAKVPRDLEAICLKCLEKDPHQRYASAEELAGDLQRFLSGAPSLARPVGSLKRAAKWARRQPTVATLSVFLLLALIVGVAAVAWALMYLFLN
jgi:hypothetical protein